MPIPRELRHLYRIPEAIASRAYALERAGGKFDERGRYVGGARCEWCLKPDRETVLTRSGKVEVDRGVMGPAMAWATERGGPWRDYRGALLSSVEVFMLLGQCSIRKIRCVLTVAHLDHNPTNNRPKNRAALCQWCHLNHDKLQHKATRSRRKDAARPLLAGVA